MNETRMNAFGGGLWLAAVLGAILLGDVARLAFGWPVEASAAAGGLVIPIVYCIDCWVRIGHLPK